MKKIRTLTIVLVAVICIGVLAICVRAENEKCLETLRFVCTAEDNTKERISLYYTDGKYYAFLPSYADFSAVHMECANGCTVQIDGVQYTSSTPCSRLKTDTDYPFVIKSLFGISLAQETLVIMQAQNVPTLSVHLTNGTVEEIDSSADKSVLKTGTCSMITADGAVDYSGSFDTLKGRGQVSWVANKKSYNISFSESTNLLNMGDNTEYCLLANAFDTSKIRNKIAYDVAKTVGTAYAIDSEFVDLYVNNEYRGLYLITESVHVGEDGINIKPLEQNTASVNYLPLKEYDPFENIDGKFKMKGYSIPNNPSDITGGYLIQTDLFSRYAIRPNTFTTDTNSFQKTPFLWSVKYPKYVSAEQMEYLCSYLKTVQKSFDGDFEKTVDVDDFVKYYLVREILANFDVNSTYFYKDSDQTDPLLHIGPVWDFDLSLGNYLSYQTPNAQAFYIHTYGICQKLYHNERFMAYVKAAYPSFRQLIDSVLEEKIAAYAAQIDCSYRMNQQRWSETPEIPESYHKYSALHLDLRTLKDNTDYITSYLSKRMSFLDETFLDNAEYATVFINMANRENRYERYAFSVKKGECLKEGSFEIPQRQYFKFLGFYDVHTGKKYDITQPVTQNVLVIARWQKTGEDPVAAQAEQPAPSGNLVMRLIQKYYLGKNRYKYYGLTVIMLAVAAFIAADIFKYAKSRRYHSGKR